MRRHIKSLQLHILGFYTIIPFIFNKFIFNLPYSSLKSRMLLKVPK